MYMLYMRLNLRIHFFLNFSKYLHNICLFYIQHNKIGKFVLTNL